MSGKGAVTIRIVGPRRTGKTSLVLDYAAKNETPLLAITLPPPPADASPIVVFNRALESRLAALAESSDPKTLRWHAAFLKLRERRQPWAEDQTLTGKISASLGFAGFELSGERARKKNVEAAAPVVSSDPITGAFQAAATLDLLDAAAGSIQARPIVFLDEIQHLLLVDARAEADSLIWSLRNTMQSHTHTRYALAGSNRRLFDLLQMGERAPFLHMGSALEIPPLTKEEIDGWALPLFRDLGGRHVRSLSAASELLCGKIGELLPVFNRLWTNSKPGDFLDEAVQRATVDAVIARTDTMETTLAHLTRVQASLLRYIVTHPGAGIYTNEARANIAGGSPGSINTALTALVDRGLVEAFGKNEFRAADPLLSLAVFQSSAPLVSPSEHIVKPFAPTPTPKLLAPRRKPAKDTGFRSEAVKITHFREQFFYLRASFRLPN